MVLPWLLALVLGAGWWLTVWTPGYLERLVPELAGDMGLELKEFRVRDAGLFSADIGPVRLGDGAGALTLANVHVTYTPASLKAGRVTSVRLDGLRFACSYAGGEFRLPVLDLLPSSENDGAGAVKSIPPLPLDRVVIRDSVLDCTVEGRAVSIPFDAEVTPGESIEFSGEVRPRDQRLRLDGVVGPTLDDLSLKITGGAVRLGAFDDLLPVPLAGTADLAAEGRVNLSAPANAVGAFDVSLTGADLRALGVRLAEDAVVEIKSELAEGTVRFSMNRVALAEPYPAALTVPAGSLSADALSMQFSLAGAGVEMGGRLDASRREAGDRLWDVSFTAVNPNRLEVQAPGRVIVLDGFIFSMQGTAAPGRADVVLNCGTRGTGLPQFGFTSGPMRLTLPLKWPAPGAHTPGKISLSGLKMDKRKLGDVTARVRQQGTDLAYGGTLRTELLPGLKVPFSGVSSMTSNRTEITFKVDDYVLSGRFDPATLSPGLKGVVLTGMLGADGGVRVGERGLESWAGVRLRDGSLTMSEGSVTATGINASFASPDLFALRSAPAQQLSFAEVRAGEIVLTNGKVAYQLESMGSVLVEQAGFDWCGGHVSSKAFRVVPDSREYNVTLFCSELKLSEILSQLGLAKARGAAALSGELPVTWKNGKISFNSGFLHSTPGEGGTIQVDAMQDLVDAIPEGTAQRGQLELAREAVRDFEYKWVRIKADTVGDDLLVRLSVDGKPASTLPFVYKREFGGFMRVTGDVKGSNFQGLRLDVNFSVPLDRILLYKDITRMIE
jgi:hypothetical protein